MTSREPQSPYQLAPGPERRAMMREMGIIASLLDYNDEEWAGMQATVAAPRTTEASVDTETPTSDHPVRRRGT